MRVVESHLLHRGSKNERTELRLAGSTECACAKSAESHVHVDEDIVVEAIARSCSKDAVSPYSKQFQSVLTKFVELLDPRARHPTKRRPCQHRRNNDAGICAETPNTLTDPSVAHQSTNTVSGCLTSAIDSRTRLFVNRMSFFASILSRNVCTRRRTPIKYEQKRPG
jgi:hypothetical protein